jgi:tetratricopeptide (TPR) repeat protein
MRQFRSVRSAVAGCVLGVVPALSAGCATFQQTDPAVIPAVGVEQTDSGVTQASAVSRPDAMAASRHVSAALEAYREGDIEQALRETERARKADPNLASAWELEAMISADAGDPVRQARALLAVADSHPGAPQIQHEAGQLLVRSQYRAAGLAALHSAIESAPRNTAYVRDLAGIYVELGQTDKAIEVLRQGLTRNPTDPTLPIALARLYESTGHWESALRFYTVSLRNNPDQAGWRRQRARCLYQLGHYADAATEFQRCLETDVGSLTKTDRIEFGDACLQTGDVSRAAWLFDEVSAEGLATREVEILRSVCALRQGQTADAEQILAGALARWPDDVALQLLLQSCRE